MENNFFENQPQQETVEQPVQAAPAGIVDKIKQIPVKVLAIAGAAVVAVIAVILLIGAFSNTYKTPVEAALKVRNAKSYSAYEKAEMATCNGFCESEMKAILNVMKKSDDYDKDDIKESYEEHVDELKDEYGSNYKYSYKIEDKEKIDKDDYKDLQEELREAGEEMLEELNDMDSDDIEEMADSLGISKSNAKKLVSEAKKIAKTMKKVKISGGYELEITYTLKGSELDEPEENDSTMTVYKVNGKWMSLSALYGVADGGF